MIDRAQMLLRASLVALLTCVAISCSVADNPKFTLPNGLQVILRTVAGAQQAAVVTLFDVGNRHDPPGACGLAHFLEHLYVTAATGRAPARTVEELVRTYPLGWNAQTGDDYTVVATVVEPAKLAAEIQEHADRMGALQIAGADIQRELPRIDAELTNMFERIPALAATNLARETLRPTPHNGRRGGSVDELKQITRDRLQSRWQQLYKPRNAILAIAGDFDPRQIRATIESAFGALPAGDKLPNASPSAALANAPPKEVVAANVFGPAQAALTFRVPDSDSSDFAPLLLLYLRLMNEASSSASLGTPPDPSILFAILDAPDFLSIMTSPKPNESAADVDRRLRSIVEKAAAAPLRPHERELAKQGLAFMLDTAPIPDAALAGNVYGVAFAAARRDQRGIVGKELAGRIERVTAADVSRVAADCFGPARGAVIIVRGADR